MSLVEHEVSPKQVAANQSNGRKSTGPRTPAGRARVALNALKTGAYAKGTSVLRKTLLKMGENPEDQEQLARDLMDSWQPDDTMQAIVVQVIADKTWDMLQLRGIRREAQLTAFEIGQIEGEREQLLARRWRPNCPPLEGAEPPMWLAEDRPSKFHAIFEILDHFQQWSENGEYPAELKREMPILYGKYHSLAGERIWRLFTDLFSGKDQQAAEKARLELPQWIAQERRDVQLEQDLYRRQSELEARGPRLSEEQVSVKEAALQRQIAEQIRLLLQLKSKRSLWPAQFEAVAAAETASVAGHGAGRGGVAESVDGPQAKPSEGEGTVAAGPVTAEKVAEGGTKPSSGLESTT